MSSETDTIPVQVLSEATISREPLPPCPKRWLAHAAYKTGKDQWSWYLTDPYDDPKDAEYALLVVIDQKSVRHDSIRVFEIPDPAKPPAPKVDVPAAIGRALEDAVTSVITRHMSRKPLEVAFNMLIRQLRIGGANL